MVFKIKEVSDEFGIVRYMPLVKKRILSTWEGFGVNKITMLPYLSFETIAFGKMEEAFECLKIWMGMYKSSNKK